MKKEVMDELIADTTLEDVGESCRPLVELIGLENNIFLWMDMEFVKKTDG